MYLVQCVLWFAFSSLRIQEKLIMRKIDVETERGTLLNGVLFDSPQKADTVVIAITGIHGNYWLMEREF